MIQTATRPFTDAEREIVETALLDITGAPQHPVGQVMGIGLLCAFFGLVCGGIPALILMILELPWTWAFSVVSVAVIIGFALGVREGRKQQQTRVDLWRQHISTLAKRLQRGEMEEVTVTASGVVEIVDTYDGINSYLFDIGDNRVLHLREETLWNAAEGYGSNRSDEETSIPSAFRLTRYLDAPNIVVHIQTLGPLLAPLQTMHVNGLEEEYYELVDGQVIEGVALTTLEMDLPYLSTVDDEP